VPSRDPSKSAIDLGHLRWSLLPLRAFLDAQNEENIMRDLTTSELKAVGGGAARKQDIPAKAPGESYKGPADKNFGPK
jgi:hypothetical protein